MQILMPLRISRAPRREITGTLAGIGIQYEGCMSRSYVIKMLAERRCNT